MKLLRDQVEEVTEDNVTVTVKVIDTVTQARLLDASQLSGAAGKARYLQIMLRECLSKVTVDGVEYDPADIAARADLSDEATCATLNKIDVAASSVLFLGAEETKKSE